MSVFEDMEFAVSNERVDDGIPVSLDNAEIIEALDQCVALSDFQSVVHTAMEKAMDENGVNSDDVESYAEFFEPDWLEIMGYSLHPESNSGANGEDAWLEQMIILFHWLQTSNVDEDKQRALLHLIEVQGWSVVMRDFTTDTEEFFDSYEGTFEDKRDFARQYGENIDEPLGQWWEDFVDWDAVVKYLDNQGYSFMEDNVTYKYHVWNNHR
jgi:hypothetical protein